MAERGNGGWERSTQWRAISHPPESTIGILSFYGAHTSAGRSQEVPGSTTDSHILMDLWPAWYPSILSHWALSLIRALKECRQTQSFPLWSIRQPLQTQGLPQAQMRIYLPIPKLLNQGRISLEEPGKEPWMLMKRCSWTSMPWWEWYL